MPRSKKKTLKALKEEREDLREYESRFLNMSGKDLLKDQVEVKFAPWHLTWVRQDMMMERQERIIELLEELIKLKKKK